MRGSPTYKYLNVLLKILRISLENLGEIWLDLCNYLLRCESNEMKLKNGRLSYFYRCGKKLFTSQTRLNNFFSCKGHE